jgi:hypothetical protein
MGLDYTGNFGVGFQVYIPELEEEHEYYDDEIGYLEYLLAATDFNYFQVGAESYSGEPNQIFVCLDNPFVEGKFNELKSIELKEFLDLYSILTDVDDIQSVGGLRVW